MASRLLFILYTYDYVVKTTIICVYKSCILILSSPLIRQRITLSCYTDVFYSVWRTYYITIVSILLADPACFQVIDLLHSHNLLPKCLLSYASDFLFSSFLGFIIYSTMSSSMSKSLQVSSLLMSDYLLVY